MILMLVLLAFCTTAQSQESVYHHDAAYPFIIISKDTVKEAPTFTDREFKENASAVYFRLNRTEIMEPDSFINLYNREILPLVNSEHLKLRKIYVRGSASPEGPYENNRRLGQGRSKVLAKELQSKLPYQDGEVELQVEGITEDYGYLCLLMEEAGDPDYELVKSVYENCGGDEPCCKRNLMKLKGGKLWQRLLKTYFPKLRAARLILWFVEPCEPEPVEPEPEPIIPEPEPEQEPDTVVVVEPEPEIVPEPEPEVILPEPARERRRHMIAIRTNLLHDFFYMPSIGWTPSPNIQFEYYPLDGHLTYNLGMTWGTRRNWTSHEFFQVRDFQFELRRYFRGGGKFTGFYLAAHLHGDVYGIGINSRKGWEGEGGAASISGGYVMPITRRGDLRLEFMAEAGYFYTRFDPYVYGNPVSGKDTGLYYYNYLGSASKFKKRNHQFGWFGPLNLGVQLTYDIIYRPKAKKEQLAQ